MITHRVEFTDDDCTIEEAASTEQRAVLPSEVSPVHYDICLQPDFETFFFEGEVTIDLKVHKNVSQILINANAIEFYEATITQPSSDEATVTVVNGKDIVVEEKDEVATIPVELKKGTASLNIKFKGEMNDLLKGFYRSKYTDVNGVEHLIGTTQFEAVDARRAFPCWDEPAAKATFTVSLVVPKDLLALSNMPEMSSTAVGDLLKKVVFDKSPIMSSYLLAWVIGDFDKLEAKTKNGTLVRMFTPVGKRQQGEFALEVATKVLPFYEEYFEIPYPLPKSDLIAIPDFSAGAMENWGLVTYREIAVLCDENSSATQKEYVALVIAHELAHQWFGNLVTMEWWSQLWLNEGFACFIEYLAVDYLYPEWHMWTEFVTTEFNSALSMDGLKNSHPIEVEIDHPSKIDEIFDRISYSKGASVIRMIQSYLSPEVFRKALVKYLNHFKYGNAITTDLWRFLGEESGKDVTRIMDNWTKKQGYPVITIEDDEEGIIVTQNRFLSGGIPPPNEDTVLWSVPILIQLGGQDEPLAELLEERRKKIKLPKDIPFYKLNINATGVFRVKYDQDGLSNLVGAVRSKELSPVDRANVLSDSLAMAKAGIAGTCDTLTLLTAYENEDDLSVWQVVSGAALAIKKIVSKTKYVEEYNAFARSLFQNLGKQLGWEEQENDSHRTKQLRAVVIAALGEFEDPETVKESMRRFQIYAKERKGVPNDLRPAVYKVAARNGGETEYTQLREVYESATDPRDRIRSLIALGASPDIKLLNQTLEYGMSEKVRKQDSIYGVCPVASNPKGTDLAWKWLQEKWVKLIPLFPAMGFMGRFAKMTEAFMTLEKADEVEKFFKSQDTSLAERNIQQALETIRLNACWFERDAEAIGAWVTERSKL